MILSATCPNSSGSIPRKTATTGFAIRAASANSASATRFDGNFETSTITSGNGGTVAITDPAVVRVQVDTTRELGFGQTTGSRGTLMGAGAVANACRAAIAEGCQTGVDYTGEYRVDWTNSLSEGLAHPVIHSAFGYAAQLVVMDRETGGIDKGRRPAN